MLAEALLDKYGVQSHCVFDQELNKWVVVEWLGEGSHPSQAQCDLIVEEYKVKAAWADIRAKRDALLTASDWTQQPDILLDDADKAAWLAYRQSLRDLPATSPAPETIVFPKAPK